ncbi:hypothetical protein SLEP1_g58527 [Rubroshorea leprosula]|uniref:NB-ARC domain-containing protein n=1 Tax=Rubroshorea leprosula TaxID=152421 RepID=A0AAV5MPR4_9ROSI|nr:hypothetical protein SLEP1_g58527 [Rubroshorea leprosula]
MADQIKDLNSALDNLNASAANLGLHYRLANNTLKLFEPAREQTGSLRSLHQPQMDRQFVLGRDDDTLKIVQLLIDSSNQQPLCVISIVGMAGIGKTTLAKLAHNNHEVSRHYKEKVWICVSQNFDVKRILKEMLDSLDPTYCGNERSIDALVQKLQEVLGEKNFLLILDGVCNEDRQKWELLKRCLLKISQNVGNKVLVTCRIMSVAIIMGSLPQHMYVVKLLRKDKAVSIIEPGVFQCSPGQLKDREHIVQDIAHGCRGFPLVVSIVEGILCNNMDIDSWLSTKEILQAWHSYQELHDVLYRLLQLTFDRLPGLALKQCFAYCSIFPKDSVMEKEMLIQLWMAQGFLQPSEESSEEMEDIGDKYFNCLLSYSLFQDEERDFHRHIVRCKMHDLIHDVAQSISKFETLILENGSASNIPNIRHLNLISYENMGPSKSRDLYSLFSKVDVRPNVPVNFKRLLVLSFCGADIDKLPTSLGKLKRLRYLDVSETKIKKLPKFISKLYNLQTFRFRSCNSLRKPPEIGDLISLRHIYFNDKKHMPTSIGRLTCLQTLPLFVVGLQKGHGIEELGCLSQLKGKLEICNLENVRDKSTAMRAQLLEKSAVYDLEFEWEYCSEERSKQNEDVFEGLVPPSNVKSLTIKGYGGENCPSWMVDEDHLFSNLVMLSLLNCHNLRSIPSFRLGNLVKLRFSFCGNLESIQSVSLSREAGLVIDNCRNLKTIAVSSLQELRIDNCDELTSIEFNTSAMESLKEVNIESCAKLRSLPVVCELATLQILHIWDCQELSSIGESLSMSTNLKELMIRKCPSLMSVPSIHGLSLLHTLSIQECDGLTSLPSGLPSCIALEQLIIHGNNLNSNLEDLNELCCLVHLDISRCRNLISIPGESLGSLACLKILCIGGFSEELEEFPVLSSISHPKPSLENLTMIGWENLRDLPHQIRHLTHLRELRIKDFHGVEALPDWLGDLTSLQTLRIIDCKSLKHMPSLEAMHHLSNLYFLRIDNCPELKVRCDREGSSEWPKISHIISIIIN